MPPTNRTQLGNIAERYVVQHLEQRGYEILDRNWRRKWGELDIVAKKDGAVIFVEVKANRDESEGFDPEVRANREKMAKVARTARTYLMSKKYPPEQEWQIDIISVTFDQPNKVAKIVHFKNVEV